MVSTSQSLEDIQSLLDQAADELHAGAEARSRFLEAEVAKARIRAEMAGSRPFESTLEVSRALRDAIRPLRDIHRDRATDVNRNVRLAHSLEPIQRQLDELQRTLSAQFDVGKLKVDPALGEQCRLLEKTIGDLQKSFAHLRSESNGEADQSGHTEEGGD